MQDLRTTSELVARDLRRAGVLSHEGSTVRFAYPDAADGLAYRLHQGVIEMQMGSGYWQAMSDVNTMRVDSFRITPQVQEITLDGFCSQPCVEGNTSCPPRQLLRSLVIQIDARAATDPTAIRSVHTAVRLRNDALVGACPA